MSALLRSLPFALLGLLLVGLLVAGVSAVLRQLNLLPPESLRMAAGPPGSAYHATAQAYRDILARDGIELELLESQGSVDNAELLAEADRVDVALVQGGVPLEGDVVGLSAVDLEPLWVFSAGSDIQEPNGWDALRVAAGGEGSGTRLVADRLQEISGATALDRSVAFARGGMAAAEALLAGELDIALFVAPATASYLQDLLASDQLKILSLAHSEALALGISGARLVRLPSGILSYPRALPPEDLDLVALVTRLVAREDIHPALVNRLMHAVKEVHGERGVLPAGEQYPSSRDLGVPVNDYAEQLLSDGFSPLENLLPYWIVAQLNRVLLVLVPALLLLLPLLRLLPALYQAVLNRRVYGHYARVHEIDEALVQRGGEMNERELRNLRGELDDIERRLLRANLPNTYRKQAYTLLHHVDYVRRRNDHLIEEREMSLSPGDASA
ncbi:MAG: TAXI family TRAP transporter solute-binding subunit [Pseudomonadota bacterium]